MQSEVALIALLRELLLGEMKELVLKLAGGSGEVLVVDFVLPHLNDAISEARSSLHNHTLAYISQREVGVILSYKHEASLPCNELMLSALGVVEQPRYSHSILRLCSVLLL